MKRDNQLFYETQVGTVTSEIAEVLNGEKSRTKFDIIDKKTK